MAKTQEHNLVRYTGNEGLSEQFISLSQRWDDQRLQLHLKLENRPELYRLFHNATLTDLYNDIEAAKARFDDRNAKSKRKKLFDCLRPIVEKIAPHGQSLDVFANIYPLGMSPVWGCMRIVIRLVQDYNQFIEETHAMFKDMEAACINLHSYTVVFAKDPRFVELLAQAYINVMQFCDVLRESCQKEASNKISFSRGQNYKKMLANIRQQFGECLKRITERAEALSTEMHGQSLVYQRATHTRVDNMLIQTDKQRKRDLLKEMSSISQKEQHNRIRETREPGTGIWLTEKNEIYGRWKNGPGSSFLWCSGIPGSGKTVLSSQVIDNLMVHTGRSKRCLAYFYCDYQYRKTLDPDEIVRCLLKQIFQQSPRQREVMSKLDEWYGMIDHQPSLSETQSALLQFIPKEDFSTTFIVIDGLDECNDGPERKKFIHWLCNTVLIHDTAVVKLFISSREEDFRDSFRNCLLIQLSDSKQNEDISLLIRRQVAENENLRELAKDDHTLLTDITKALEEGAKGMFLWACLQIAVISEEPSPKAIRESLKKLPEDLNAIYQRAMDKIKKKSPSIRDMVSKTFLWIAGAKRSLNKSELQEALAISYGDEELDFSKRPAENQIVPKCANLVIEASDGTIRFAHYTVLEYLQKIDQCYRQADQYLGVICLTYLSFKNFTLEVVQAGPTASSLLANTKASTMPQLLSLAGVRDRDVRVGLRLHKIGIFGKNAPLDLQNIRIPKRKAAENGRHDTYALEAYISKHWLHHLRFDPIAGFQFDNLSIHFPRLSVEDLRKMLKSVCSRQLPFEFLPWKRLAEREDWYRFCWAVENDHLLLLDLLSDEKIASFCKIQMNSGLYPAEEAVKCSSNSVFVRLLDASLKIFNEGGLELSPEHDIQFLKTSTEAWILSAIHFCIDGNYPLLTHLLERCESSGMEIKDNGSNKGGITAIQKAIESRSLDAVRALSHGKFYEFELWSYPLGDTPIHTAAAVGDVEILECLCDSDLLNICYSHKKLLNNAGQNPLHYAAKFNNAYAAKYIISASLNSKISCNWQYRFRSPSTEARPGIRNIYDLPDVGHINDLSDVDFRLDIDTDGLSPIHLAVVDEEIFKVLLLTHSSDTPEFPENKWREYICMTPITTSLSELLNLGTDVKPLLHHAVKYGSVSVVRTLIEAFSVFDQNHSNTPFGIDQKDREGRTALWCACIESYELFDENKVRLLTDSGAGWAAKDPSGTSLLSDAIVLYTRSVIRGAKLKSSREENTEHDPGLNVLDLVQACFGESDLQKAKIVIDNFPFASTVERTLMQEYLRIVSVVSIAHEKDVFMAEWPNILILLATDPDSDLSCIVVHACVRILGGEIVDTDLQGKTALMIMALNNRANDVELLLKCGANPSIQIKFDGSTPLHAAARGGHLEVAELLIDAGASPHASDDTKSTPVELAAKGGHRELLELFDRKGFSLNFYNKGHTPLQKLVKEGHSKGVETLLQLSAVDVNYESRDGSTALHSAISASKIDMALLLLAKGASISAKDSSGKDALHWAAFSSSKSFMALLPFAGGDIEISRVDADGLTYLHQALLGGQDDVVHYILMNWSLNCVPPLIEIRDKKGNTPLHVAASAAPRLIATLLENGAPADVVADDGWSPAHILALKGDLENIALLALKGANLERKNSEGLDVWGILGEEKVGELRDRLRQSGIMEKDVDGDNSSVDDSSLPPS